MNFNLVSITLDGNLKECLDLMKKNKIHRVIIEDTKSSTFTGFVTFEIIFDFFFNNFYSDMVNFNNEISSMNIISNKIITAKKSDTIYSCLVKFWTHKVSILPIEDDMNDGDCDYFGYFFLKDIVYFFSNGDKFSFTDSIEKFIKDVYEDIEVERPYGKERIVITELEGTNLKTAMEMMTLSPERKIIFKNKNCDRPIGILTLSDIFKIININECS